MTSKSGTAQAFEKAMIDLRSATDSEGRRVILHHGPPYTSQSLKLSLSRLSEARAGDVGDPNPDALRALARNRQLLRRCIEAAEAHERAVK